MSSLVASVVICTHNRASLLRKAIQSIEAQTFDRKRFELLIIDNGSVDETKTIVKEFEHLGNLRYIYEPFLGISRARNTGWQSALAPLVAYLDDDAIAEPDWLEKILHVFETVKPSPGVVGGQVKPIWEVDPPEWLDWRMKNDLAILDFSEEPTWLTEKQYLISANSAYPRTLLEQCGGFHSELGRVGKSGLISYEEYYLNKQIAASGHKLYFDPRIRATHLVPKERLAKKWFLKRAYWNGYGIAIVHTLTQNLTRKKRIHLALKRIWLQVNRLFIGFLWTLKYRQFKDLTFRYETRYQFGYIRSLLTYRSHVTLSPKYEPKQTKPTSISVIICTYNRETFLRKALKSLAAQNLSQDRYEIIVIDNGSTDRTKKTVEEFGELPNLNYVYEPILGLSQARNTGWKMSRSPIVAYLDDDAVAPSDWLEKILTIFQTVQPTPGVVGGKIDPQWGKKPPDWLHKDLERSLSILDLSESPKWLQKEQSHKEYLVGANIAYRKNLLEHYGGFPTELSRVGLKGCLNYDEYFVNRKITEGGEGLYYHPDMKVEHFIHEDRLNKHWFLKRYFWNGYGFAVANILIEDPSWKTRSSMALKHTLVYIKRWGLILLRTVTGRKRKGVENFCSLQYKLGYIWGLLGYHKKRQPDQ